MDSGDEKVTIRFFKLLRKLIRYDSSSIASLLNHGLVLIVPLSEIGNRLPVFTLQYLKYLNLCFKVNRELSLTLPSDLIDSLLSDLQSLYGITTELNVLIIDIFSGFSVEDKQSLFLINHMIHLFIMDNLFSNNIPSAIIPEAFTILISCANNNECGVANEIVQKFDFNLLGDIIRDSRPLVFKFICMFLQAIFTNVPNSVDSAPTIPEAIESRINSKCSAPEKEAAALATLTAFQNGESQEIQMLWLLPSMIENLVYYIFSVPESDLENIKTAVTKIWNLSENNSDIREILSSLCEIEKFNL